MEKVLFFSLRIFSALPFRVLYALSDVLFFFLYHVVRYRRRIVRKNLSSSFPEKSEAEILRIEKRFYHFFLDMIFESCKLFTISEEEMRRRARFVNAEVVNEMLREGKTVSVFIGHYANWEWITTFALWLDERARAAQVYHKLRNEKINRFVLALRSRFGHESVEMYQTVRFAATVAKGAEPYALGFIADQSPKKREVKHFIPFLNHNVPVLTGTEKLTKHFRFEALYLRVRRTGRGYYEYEFLPLADDPSTLPDFELTARYYRQLEEDIRHTPELYLWTHNRFKHATML